jgi:two-component system KDP operon response regulator KdpE
MNATSAKNPLVRLIADDIQVRQQLRACLEGIGHQVCETAIGDDGIDESIARQADVVVLDLGLADPHSLANLKRLRSLTQAPILVVSGWAREGDRIAALDAGADDYITKPFNNEEVLARLRLVRCRSQWTEIFHSGPLKVDLTRRSVSVAGRSVRLTATEYSLLRLLVQHAGKVLPHAQILREVWGPGDTDKIGYLRVYITHLREKLELTRTEPRLIITEPCVGYRLVLQG